MKERGAAACQLASRLGGPAVLSEVQLAVADPESYARRFAQRMDDRSLEIDKHLPWYALIDALDDRKRLASLDWKQEADDTLRYVARLSGGKAKSELTSLANKPGTTERGTEEALELAGGVVDRHKLALLQLYTLSDSFHIVVAPLGEAIALTTLAKKAGQKIVHFTGRRFAALEKQRLDRLAKEKARYWSKNLWTQLLELYNSRNPLISLRHDPSLLERIRQAAPMAPKRERPLIDTVIALHDRPPIQLARTTKDASLCLRALVFFGEQTVERAQARFQAAAILARRLALEPGPGKENLALVGALGLWSSVKEQDATVAALSLGDRTLLARLTDGLLRGAAPESDRWKVAMGVIAIVGDAESIVALEKAKPKSHQFREQYCEAIDKLIARIRKRKV
jgi:hypothetical protein